MKYLKKIFESYTLTNRAKKVLSDFNYTEDDFKELHDYMGHQYYPTINDRLGKWFSDSYGKEFDFGYEQFRNLDALYNELKKEKEELELIEDFFIDEIDENKMRIRFEEGSIKVIRIIIPIPNGINLIQMSDELKNIHNRLDRSKTIYNILEVLTISGGKEIVIRIKIH